ncbi:hypothetical protein JFV29_12435 [Peribacillus sp. TH16]|uniref:hypothetical protein n=1 Tax=Peribacillus sp. TH16 TaxID=2798482 RepID=UPI0019131289|nr:hypothetical protein [Peribacillus sp. TH16]MBK5482690.1 hypothetical protein [Peribacillus sp. TH16]
MEPRPTARHSINPALTFESLEEAKQHKLDGHIIITNEHKSYSCVESSELSYWEELGYTLVK